MSHFTVGVIIKDNKNIEDDVRNALLPFDENLEAPAYVSMTIKELEEKLQEIRTYEGDNSFSLKLKKNYKNITLKGFCKSYYEKELHEGIGIMSTYNKNSKWDWYQIGGRWDNCVPIKGCSENDNICKIKDLELFAEVSEVEKAGLRKKYIKLTTEGDFYKPEYYLDKYPTFENYLNDIASFSTYALLTSNGEWLEPGEMGYFGCSSASPQEEVNFATIFKEAIEKENPEHYFVLVDCHI